jgi:hypothetical protein
MTISCARGGGIMLRMVTGGILALSGAVLFVLAAGFIRGPVFYWRDLFGAVPLQMWALLTGSAALVLGAVFIASALLRRSAAR